MSEPNDESRSRRRIIVLLFVSTLVLVGAGIGSVTLLNADGVTADDSTDPTEPTPTDEGTTGTDTGASAGVTVSTEPSTATPDATATATTGTPSTTTTEPPTTTPRSETTPTETTTETTTQTTPTETPTESGEDEDSAGGANDGGSSDEKTTVSLTTPGDVTLLEATSVVPGDSGIETLTLENSGERSGRVRLASTTIVDSENGIVDPEAPVDDTPDEGELSEAVEVRMSVQYPDGEDVTVVGSDDFFVALSSVDRAQAPEKTVSPGERVTVELEWRIDRSAGNEIQTDRVTFDAVFELFAPES